MKKSCPHALSVNGNSDREEVRRRRMRKMGIRLPHPLIHISEGSHWVNTSPCDNQRDKNDTRRSRRSPFLTVSFSSPISSELKQFSIPLGSSILILQQMHVFFWNHFLNARPATANASTDPIFLLSFLWGPRQMFSLRHRERIPEPQRLLLSFCTRFMAGSL